MDAAILAVGAFVTSAISATTGVAGGAMLLGRRLVGHISEQMFVWILKGSLTLIAVKLLVWG